MRFHRVPRGRKSQSLRTSNAVSAPLNAAPPRRPLLQKRRPPLDSVRVLETLHHRPRGQRISVGERHLDLLVEGALAEGDARGRAAGDEGGHRVGGGERFAGWRHAVDEADRLGALGVYEFRRQRHLHRVLARDGAPDRHQRRRAEAAFARAGQGKAGVAPGDGEIASRHELAAGGGGDPLHGGDHGLGVLGQPAHEQRAAVEQLFVESLAAVEIVAVGLNLAQVVAGAEHRPLAGDDDGAHRIIPGEFVEGGDERVDHQQTQRVARGGRSEGDRRHAGVVVATEKGGGRRGHRWAPQG